MLVGLIIKRMFPNADVSDFEVTRYADDSWEITKWNISEPQPTVEEIEAYWNKYGDEIIATQEAEIKKNSQSKVELLEQENIEIKLALAELAEAVLGGD